MFATAIAATALLATGLPRAAADASVMASFNVDTCAHEQVTAGDGVRTRGHALARTPSGRTRSALANHNVAFSPAGLHVDGRRRRQPAELRPL